MIRRPIIISLLILIAVLAISALCYFNWKENTIAPLESTVTRVWGVKTEQAISKATQNTIYQDKTATADQALFYSQQTSTKASWDITATAMPTPTPALNQKCMAEVIGKEAVLYQEPGLNPNPSMRTKLSTKQVVEIIGKLEDPAWLYVETEGVRGFVDSSFLHVSSFGCEPELIDIHYAAGYLDNPNWRLVLEDSFARNTTVWYSPDGNMQFNINPSVPDAALIASSYGERRELTNDRLLARTFSAFQVNFNANVTMLNSGGYFGLRILREDGTNYEIHFKPYYCEYWMVFEDTELFSGRIDRSLCFKNRDYQVMFKLDESHQLFVSINGEEKGPTKIIMNEEIDLSGRISLIVDNLLVNFNYITITAPKE